MTLKEKVQSDLIAAMKAGDELRKDTLKMLKASIMKFETDGAKKEADDDAVLQIVKREVKQRRDAAEGFRSGGNDEMAAKEESEATVLQEYLPEQMSEEAVREKVSAILAAEGITSKADMGRAMGAVMKELKDKADGKVINQTVAQLLN